MAPHPRITLPEVRMMIILAIVVLCTIELLCYILNNLSDLRSRIDKGGK